MCQPFLHHGVCIVIHEAQTFIVLIAFIVRNVTAIMCCGMLIYKFYSYCDGNIALCSAKIRMTPVMQYTVANTCIIIHQ